jgi:hypothetical protein
MKRQLALALGAIALAATLGTAQAADIPAKQEGRIWIDQNFVLAFSPNWSWTVMPGARGEFARGRENATGLQFMELFFGPNYTYKTGNWTFKGSLWYYYMGYPQRGRLKEAAPAYDGTTVCSTAPLDASKSPYCTSTYNFSHNLEIVPTVEYRFGRWSLYDRMIFHNTFYADAYGTPYTGTDGTSIGVGDQRWGFGTVLRELLQLRFAVTDRLGAFISDEVFLGIIEDGDTSKMKKADGTPTGYNPLGYWKHGFRSNRVYLGIDYKVSPNFTVVPMYMVDATVSPIDSTDLTDVAHTFFLIATVTASTFGSK